MVQAPTCYALFCPDHGLQFTNEDYFNQDATICPTSGCKRLADREEILLKGATLDGCAFCKKSPLKEKFLYDERTGKVFCHPHCYKCFKRDCLMKGCCAQAKYTMFLVVHTPRGTEEYVIPVSYCEFHSKNLPTKPDDNIWNYIRGTIKTLGHDEPVRENCTLEMRELEMLEE